ncbi:hypothetical protein [Bacillus altitudinis]|uniref:hypothetical protein n=1 Tax=Bacillus altitudinis TaxID=293387 RepID=UPI003D77FCB9
MKEAIQFLKELQKELNAQDVDCQAAPRFWTVGDYKWVETSEDNAERYTVVLPNAAECYPVDSYIESAKEDGEHSEEDLKKLDDCDDDLDDILRWIQDHDEEDAYLVPEKEIHVVKPNTMFITKAEAKEHIRLNQHHYSHKAHTYAMTALRAPKVAKVWEILQEFDWDSVENAVNHKRQQEGY